jgi:chromosome partitioning protein
MTRILALANQKGGVGKTTTALNLGAALAARGRRILLVDLDPQSNLTMCLGLNPREQPHTSYEVLHNPDRGVAYAIQSMRATLDLIPATPDMAAAEQELAGKIGRETLLRKALRNVRGEYDYILIDPPPSLGLFTLNALAAATDVVIPLQVEYLPLQGIGQLQTTIGLLRELNPPLKIDGLLCTRVDNRKSLSRVIETRIRKALGKKVYQTTIPENVRVAESPIRGKPITEYDPTCAGALAYTALAEEVEHGAPA